MRLLEHELLAVGKASQFWACHQSSTLCSPVSLARDEDYIANCKQRKHGLPLVGKAGRLEGESFRGDGRALRGALVADHTDVCICQNSGSYVYTDDLGLYGLNGCTPSNSYVENLTTIVTVLGGRTPHCPRPAPNPGSAGALTLDFPASGHKYMLFMPPSRWYSCYSSLS